MRSRTVLCSASALSALALLSGCGNSESLPTVDAPLVGVDYPRSDTDFWRSFIQYTPRYSGQLGLTLKTTNSHNDASRLASDAQALMDQGVKGIVIAPQDTAAITPTLKQLAAKKIPVVSVDTRPDKGKVYMVVRADNHAYGEAACRYLGAELNGAGKVVMLEGDLFSVNGRDRTEAFNACMKKNYPDIEVFGEATSWDGNVAARKLRADLTAHPDIKGIYMQSSFALSGTIQTLKDKGMLVGRESSSHVFVVSNDGIPAELRYIASGKIDATVSQPADLYARYAIYYLNAALKGKKFRTGKTDHDSTIVQVRPGLLEDQLPAPLVTADGGTYGGMHSTKYNDASLWGNNLG
ncbi:sugar ABC transporter substrate-binding protein [Streptomyces sp. NPDC001228]|uniref:sugar ABC transporter substrate-binding protein n=1 Tax=Streptomyces sp. NPDC001228 TaxID=3154381 RepID=UPI00331E3471